jgi:hypothetical protein
MNKTKRDRTISPGPAPLSRSAPRVYFRRAGTRTGRSAFAVSAALAIPAAPSAPATSVEIHSIVIVISPISLRVAAASVSADPTSSRGDSLHPMCL